MNSESSIVLGAITHISMDQYPWSLKSSQSSGEGQKHTQKDCTLPGVSR